MHILILSPFFPWPLSQGGKIRVFNIIKHLSVNHKITLACLSDEKMSDYGPLESLCEEIVCIERRRNPVRDLPVFLFGNEPFNFVRFSSHAFRDALQRLLKRKSFDLLQVEFSMMWQYARIFKGIPAVLDAHNIEADIVRQIGKTQKNPLRRFLYVLEEKKLRGSEGKAWRECDLCFAVSEKEREVITSQSDSGRVVTIPNGVDLKRFKFVPKTGEGKQLLFIGGMEYLPNLDSALYLFCEIYPRVRAIEPYARLDIVGRELRRIRNRYDDGNVLFFENVPDVLPYFRKADILLVPLRSGAGTRIKILEAMAAGLPVVTTTKGSEGLDVRSGEHLLVADDPGAFARAVAQILNDPALRSGITHNARRLVEKIYSWESLVQAIERAYETL